MRLNHLTALGSILAILSVFGVARAELIRTGIGSEENLLSLESEAPTGVELRFQMGSFGIEPVEIRGEAKKKITLPGVFLPGEPGRPDLPGMGRFVAIPGGASARVQILSSHTEVYEGFDIAPAPEINSEENDTPLEYERDGSVYARDAFYPESPVGLSGTRRVRGIDVVSLGITPFQYNPVRKELIVYTDLEIRIDFEGGSGQFGDERLRNRYWEPILRDHLTNYASLPPVDFDGPPMTRSGYEYVIIVPDDPDFIAWADTLRSWRTVQGISTGVFTTTDVGGTSSEAIESFLDYAYANWDPAPAAFLLLGDYPEAGAPESGIASPRWNDYCAADNIYADVDEDHLPDMIASRITARDSTELAIMIGKVLSYERQPVTDADFYNHPLIAGGWQTSRWFTLCSEIIYGHQSLVLGKEPVREYAIYSGVPGDVWSTNVNTPLVVDHFGPDSLGYIPENATYLTDWSGSAAGINAAINAGTYMVFHRDHGDEHGWGEPGYLIEDLADLTNDKLPFAFNINCQTGAYDNPEECFVEASHRMPGGILGTVAASAFSFSFVNDVFAWGMFDALWPNFDPTYGDASRDTTGGTSLRTAFAMASGLYFLEASSWPSNPEAKIATYNLYHHHGDAYTTLYSEVPEELTVDHYPTCPMNAEWFAVQADSGAVIALTVNGEIVGVADATGQPQAVEMVPQVEPGTLRITVTKANHFRYDETVPIVGTSFVVKPDSTGDFYTIQDAIDAAGEGQLIELTDGLFRGDGNRDLDYLGKAITIRSMSADPGRCVLDCEGTELEPHRSVTFGSAEGASSVLEGVTIRNGYDPGFGGGILCDTLATPTIANCIFSANRAPRGGAVYCDSLAAATFDDCLFRDNIADSLGGALAVHRADPILTSCRFETNSAPYGGAIHINEASPSIGLSTFSSNTADSAGAACLARAASSLSLTSCTFFGNAAGLAGGALYCDSLATATLEQTIIAFGTTGEAIYVHDSSDVMLSCCDLYGNEGGDWTTPIADQLGVDGNVSSDPLFCDAAGGDLTLNESSLWALGNFETCGLVGAWPVGCEPKVTTIAPDGSGDFPTLQEAIDQAGTGEIVELLDGIYTGDGNRDVDFHGKPVTVRSQSGDAATCVIDAEGTELEPHRVVLFQSEEGPHAVLEGITLTGGYAPTGGAVLCRQSSPTITGCVFTDNYADSLGGALLCDTLAAPQLIDCRLTGNAADSCGGALAIMTEASPILTGCTLDGNTATDGGAAITAMGATPTFSYCTFYGNDSVKGAGLCIADTSSPVLDHVIIAFSAGGAAVHCDGTGRPIISCCDVYGNEGGDWVGCIADIAGTNGNLESDPFFCDAENGCFTLYDNSPCAPEMNGECGLIGAWPVGCERPYLVRADGSGTYATIQDALDASFDGIVELEDGIFTGEGNRDLNFRGKPVTLRSASGAPEACILDCEGTPSNQHQGFRCHSGELETTVISGITIRNAYGNFGGAFFCTESSPTITECVLSGNTAQLGAAVYCQDASPTVANCTLVDNTASAGSALYVSGLSEVTITNAIIANNGPAEPVICLDGIVTVSCTNIYGNVGGDWTNCVSEQFGVNDNFSEDPVFCNLADGDYSLDVTSPCTEELSPGECGLIGGLPIGCDLSEVEQLSDVPARLSLTAVSPMTFRGQAAIRFAVPGSEPAPVTLRLYDASGRLIRTLIDGEHAPGVYTLTWDGTGRHRAPLASGVYFWQLSHAGRSCTRNLVIVR